MRSYKTCDAKHVIESMTINLDSENQNVSKLKMMMMMIGFEISTWIRSSMSTIPLLKKKTKVRRYVFHNDEIQAEVKRTKWIENDSDDY